MSPRRKTILHPSSTLGLVQGNCYAAADAAETANSPNLVPDLQALALVKAMDALRAAAAGLNERMAFLVRTHSIQVPEGFKRKDSNDSSAVVGSSEGAREIGRDAERDIER